MAKHQDGIILHDNFHVQESQVTGYKSEAQVTGYSQKSKSQVTGYKSEAQVTSHRL